MAVLFTFNEVSHVIPLVNRHWIDLSVSKRISNLLYGEEAILREHLPYYLKNNRVISRRFSGGIYWSFLTTGKTNCFMKLLGLVIHFHLAF